MNDAPNSLRSSDPFKFDLQHWIASTGYRAPVKSLAEIFRSGRYHPSIQKRLEQAEAVQLPPDSTPACANRERFRDALRAMVVRAMDGQRLDALVYPTWSNPPRLTGDLNTPPGDNNQLFSPSTGFPAIAVPMGYLRGGVLPSGLQFFGRAWSEPALFRLAYGHEQTTHHRRPPTTVPPLR